MKEKERFISIDDSGESIFTFDEADMIIDTKTNIVYGANNVPDLVKILNFQSSQWQKLKEWLEEVSKILDKTYACIVRHNGSLLLDEWYKGMVAKEILDKMQELEGEDE